MSSRDELEKLRRFRIDSIRQQLDNPTQEQQSIIDTGRGIVEKTWSDHITKQREQTRQNTWDSAITLSIDDPSTMEAYIWNNYSGKERDDAYKQLDYSYNTPGTKYYDPYHKKVTNQGYLDNLASLGVEVPKVVTSDWLDQMAQQYRGSFKYSDASGNPNSPGTKKNVTADQKIAYTIWQLQQDEGTTEKAEAEWADYKQKVTYWAQKGLSDKEIEAKIDMKKYPTLAKMDESRTAGNYVPMNRQIGYSKDAVKGVMWKARNGYGDDMDDFQAAVRSKLGQGRGDRSTAKQIAQRTVGTSEYNPYVGGSNDDDARMTMGIKSWDNEWLKAHQQDMFAAGQEDLWRQMDKELGNYEAAKKQYDILDKWVSGYNYDFDAENIRAVVDKLSADLDDRLNNTSGLYMDEIDGAGKLKSLTDMDEGRRTGKPVGLSDELNYRKEDVLAEMVQRYFLQNGQKITGEQAAYAVSHADEMDKAAAKEAEEAAKAAGTVSGTTETQEPAAPETTPAPVTDPVEQVLHAPETETSDEWEDQYGRRVEDYTTSHPSNGTFNNNFMVPIMNTEGAQSGSLRDAPRMADGAMSTEGKKLPEQSYLNVKNGKVYTRSQLETALTNMFMGVELNEEETAAASMLVKTIPWAFRTKKKVAAPMSAWSTFENNGQPIFDALDASESGYATAKDQAQMALAFYDDAARAAASGLNIATYYKEHPEEYTDIQSVINKIYNRRDTQLAEAAQKAEEDKTNRLATGKAIVGKLGSDRGLTADEQTFLQGILPTGDPQERDTYLGRKSVNNEYLKSIDYDTKLSDAQDAWYESQRATNTGINVDQFALDSKLDGITELMEQSIIFDAKLAESAGMTLEEYYQKTGSLNLEDRFRQAQEQWEAREAPENRTDEQNLGIGLYGVWAGLKMGSIDTAAGYVGFAADIAGMNNTDQHKGIKESWLEYTFGNDVSSVVEARSSYRSAVLAYADSLNESDPQRADALRNMMYEATANEEDIFNVPFDISLDKLERAYESLQKINAVEQEYIDTHATNFEKAAVRQWRSAVSSLERMGISTALSFAGAPGAVAGAVAFFPGTYDSTYRAEVASNGGDKTSAAVYAGISAMIDTFTEQAFLSKWYNFGGEAAQSWLLNMQKAQLAKIGPAGTAGNIAHRAAAYFLGWAATASAETLQELGQDGISTVWDFVYHGRDVNWLKDQFDFINNPEARQNLVDTIASTLMSVTFSYNGQQILGRGNVTRDGDGATAFSSYNVLQRNRLVGEQMRKLDAQRKVDEQTLAEDTSDMTVDLGEEETTAPEAPVAQEQPAAQEQSTAQEQPEQEAPAAQEPDIVFPETNPNERYKQTEMKGLGRRKWGVRSTQEAPAEMNDESVSPGQISMDEYAATQEKLRQMASAPPPGFSPNEQYEQLEMDGLGRRRRVKPTQPVAESVADESVSPGQISMDEYAADQEKERLETTTVPNFNEAVDNGRYEQTGMFPGYKGPSVSSEEGSDTAGASTLGVSGQISMEESMGLQAEERYNQAVDTGEKAIEQAYVSSEGQKEKHLESILNSAVEKYNAARAKWSAKLDALKNEAKQAEEDYQAQRATLQRDVDYAQREVDRCNELRKEASTELFNLREKHAEEKAAAEQRREEKKKAAWDRYRELQEMGYKPHKPNFSEPDIKPSNGPTLNERVEAEAERRLERARENYDKAVEELKAAQEKQTAARHEASEKKKAFWDLQETANKALEPLRDVMGKASDALNAFKEQVHDTLDFQREADSKIRDMRFAVDDRVNILGDLGYLVEEIGEGIANFADETFPYQRNLFKKAIDLVKEGAAQGFGQGLEISDDILNETNPQTLVSAVEAVADELTGQLGAMTIRANDILRDAALKVSLYTLYSTPELREEAIKNMTEQYTSEAIMAGRLTEDADAKNAVKATEDAKNELDAATEEQNQAEAALQTAQQNLDNVTANRGQEGWSPKQEISAAKGVDTAKKNAETSRKKAKNSKEKYDRAKENSDAVLDAKRESLEAEAKDVATVKFDQEAAEFTTNVNHIDEPIVPDTPAPNAEPTTTIRTDEENAALAQDANAEANRLDSLTPEQEAAETQQNAEGLAKAEEEEENLPMQGPKLPITTTFGNRLRSEAVNEKGKQILTKAQTDSIEKAIIGDNDMADFFNDLSAEDLPRFVNDFKGKTRSRTASFMRNWMETELQQKAAAESGIDKAAVIKKLKSEVRKAIKAKDYSIVEKAMEKYIEGHEDLFDIALDADGIYIDGENISFNGAFSEDMSDGVGDAPADTDTPDINDQMESLLPEQEEPEGEPLELPDEEEAPVAEAPIAEAPVAEAPVAEAPVTEAPMEQPAAETPAEQPAAEAPKEEKPKRKRTPKKPKPVIAEEVSMESTSDSLTQSLSDDLKAAIGGDKLAQAIIKQVNDAQNAYNKAQADVMDDTKKVDITALTQAMDETKEKIQQMTESFNRRVGMLQRKVQADQRAEARKSVDRSEARQAEVSTLLEGVAKRVEKILDKAKNSKAKNPKPMNYKDARDLVTDLRSILDVGLATMENDIGANEIGKLAEMVKTFTPAFDAVNELSELTGEEAAPGSIKSLNAAFIRAGKALVAAQANRNASDEGKQTFLNARTALTAAWNKLMAYAHDMDARLVQMTPVESRAYADLSRPGRRTDITAGPETQARQSPIKTFQRLANDLRIGHYDVDRKTIPRGALGVYHPFADSIGIKRNYANDAYVTMHEIGHAIEERTNFHGDMAMISAADPALMSQYSAADQPHEAVAEFVRTYMMDRQSAISVYGQATVDRFETECKSNNIWKEVSRAALDIHDYTMANTGSQVQSRISNFQHRKQPMGLRRTIHEGLRAAIVNTTDDTLAAKDFDDIAAKDRSDNAMSVRQRLRFGKFASRQGRGLITEQYSTPDNQITGVSFAQAISEDAATGKTLLKTQEDYDILSRYMLLLQARTRYANAATEAVNNLPATATAAEIDAAIKEATAKTTVFGDSITINEIGAEIKNIEDNYGNVVTAQRQLAAWWQTFMRDWMPVAGISAQTVEDLIEKYPNYCPTQRDMPDGRNGRNTKNSQNSNWAYGFQRIKGSDLDVINPLITMQSTIVKTVEAARRNEAVGAIVQALNTSQDLGEYAHIVQGDFDITTIRANMIKDAVADAFGKAVRSGLNPQMSTIDSIGMFIDDVTEFRKIQYTSEPNTVAYQQDGKVTLVKFDDPVLYDAVMAGNPQAGPIASVLGKLTRNMSLLTTGMNVLFTAKNLVRDYQQGTVWGSWNSSIVSPLGLAKWIAAASEVIRGEVGKNSQHLAEYKAMGGEGYGSINMPSSERQANDLMRNLYEMYGMNAAQKGGLFARKALIDWIDTVNGVIEQTTRYVEYRYGKHDLSTPEGRAKAFLAAQDATVDFARKGNGKVAASLRAMIPFYNAALQGTWQVFDAAVDNDQKSRRAVRAAKLAVNNMILGAMSYMALQMIGSDEDKEWYEKLPLAIRLDNIILPFQNSENHSRQFIRLPVAQNWASRAFYAAGLALARGNNGDEDGMNILAVAGNILGNWVQTDFIFAPELAIMKNQSWTGSTLVPSRMKDWKASEQFNQTTPEIFKFISRGLSQLPGGGIQISPIHLQYLAQQHSGVLGQVFIPMLSPDSLDNYQLNPVGQVLRTLRNSWTIDPAYTNDVNDAYYEGKSFIENIPSVVKEHGYSDRLSTNLSEEEAQDAVDTAAQMTGTYGALTAIDKQIGEIRAQQNTIIENTELSPNEKEVQRRNLQREIVKLEEQAVGIINEYKQTYCTGTDPLLHTVFGGAHAGKASVLATKPTQFLDDYRAGEEYIKTAVDVYTATGESVIPNPAASITSNKEQFKIKAFAEDDGTPIWDSYVNAYQTQYKKAYASYDWKNLSDEQKVVALKACGKSANAAAKAYFLEWYRGKQR